MYPEVEGGWRALSEGKERNEWMWRVELDLNRVYATRCIGFIEVPDSWGPERYRACESWQLLFREHRFKVC